MHTTSLPLWNAETCSQQSIMRGTGLFCFWAAEKCRMFYALVEKKSRIKPWGIAITPQPTREPFRKLTAPPTRGRPAIFAACLGATGWLFRYNSRRWRGRGASLFPLPQCVRLVVLTLSTRLFVGRRRLLGKMGQLERGQQLSVGRLR